MHMTDFQVDLVKSNETSETDELANDIELSNDDFLRTLFGTIADDVAPLVTSFKGNPKNVPGGAWQSRCWREGETPLQAKTNNYFTLATFRPNEAGKYRRRKSQFVALHVVMLDDIGSKVPHERLTLPPTWLLETSPGNHQAGYLLAEPIIDGLLADRLMQAIIDAGLCDPGANGPRTRLARLPVAVNGKHTPPFQSRLVDWEPELAYTFDELVSGLQLDMRGNRQRDRTKEKLSSQIQPMGQINDEVWIPRPEKNAVLTALRDRGFYKSSLGEGKHDITCPWVTEHTDTIDGGTAYFEPGDEWPIGGFKCHHGHCAQRHVHDLLSYLGVEISAARMKPIIRIIAGEIHRVVDVAERELAQVGRYYQRGGMIVTVTTDPGTHETRVQEVTLPALVSALAGAALWVRFDGRTQDWMRTDPPARHASGLFDATDYPHLPVLKGIARQPYLRPDGSLMNTPGYDSETQMFGVFNAHDFSISEAPTRAEAEVAMAVLQDLLTEFSFHSEVDRSAALTAMLTATVRASLPAAPMFHMRAHMSGSGKSYLCELITAFATPQRDTPTSFPADDEECRKLLLAELLRSPAVVVFDNLTGDLVAHKSLCTTLTSEFMSGRILGVSKTATVTTRALFLSSGNNVGPVQDMTRRCITIRLSPQCEVPAARLFTRPELVRDVLRERQRYVSAALTIIRAWIVAGRPKCECPTLASFGDWSDLCRQPILWLGGLDATESVFKAMTEDPDRETLARLLHAWQDVFGKTATMVRDAVAQSTSFHDKNSELREILNDIASERGEINRRKLGWWIRRHAGRIVDGLRIVRAGNGAGNGPAERWRVESVDTTSVSPVSSVVNGLNENFGAIADAYSQASRGG